MSVSNDDRSVVYVQRLWMHVICGTWTDGQTDLGLAVHRVEHKALYVMLRVRTWKNSIKIITC